MEEERDALRQAVDDLVREALAPLSLGFGATVTSSRRRTIPSLTHDERGAPLDARDAGRLVSLTDEGEACVCVWAYPRLGSGLVGVGVDLASTEDFAGRRGECFNRLLFSAGEHSFVRERYAGREEVGFAYAFSAKEAAFKSLAAPLRTWYETHEEELVFEVREFELSDATHARGTLRQARAQAAMDVLGVRAIELCHRELAGTVLTCALARG